MTTRVKVSVEYGSVRVTNYSGDNDGNVQASNGKLLKAQESEDFTVWKGMALTIEELPAASAEEVQLAQAKEPLHEGQVLSPHEVYAQPIKQSEL